MLSAVYLFTYLSLGAVVLMLGRLATVHGLTVAVELGAVAIAAMSLAPLP